MADNEVMTGFNTDMNIVESVVENIVENFGIKEGERYVKSN